MRNPYNTYYTLTIVSITVYCIFAFTSIDAAKQDDMLQGILNILGIMVIGNMFLAMLVHFKQSIHNQVIDVDYVDITPDANSQRIIDNMVNTLPRRSITYELYCSICPNPVSKDWFDLRVEYLLSTGKRVVTMLVLFISLASFTTPDEPHIIRYRTCMSVLKLSNTPDNCKVCAELTNLDCDNVVILNTTVHHINSQYFYTVDYTRNGDTVGLDMLSPIEYKIFMDNH